MEVERVEYGNQRLDYGSARLDYGSAEERFGNAEGRDLSLCKSLKHEISVSLRQNFVIRQMSSPLLLFCLGKCYIVCFL